MPLEADNKTCKTLIHVNTCDRPAKAEYWAQTNSKLYWKQVNAIKADQRLPQNSQTTRWLCEWCKCFFWQFVELIWWKWCWAMWLNDYIAAVCHSRLNWEGYCLRSGRQTVFHTTFHTWNMAEICKGCLTCKRSSKKETNWHQRGDILYVLNEL